MTFALRELRAGSHVAMPLGGIGTGSVAICGDGSLRQWQLLGRPHHTASLPDSFFAIRCVGFADQLSFVRVLQSEAALEQRERTPLVSDGDVPAFQRSLLERFGGVAQTSIETCYPVARVHYRDPQLPLSVTLRAWNPLIPLDEAASALPAAIFEFELCSEARGRVSGCVASALQNFIGWDGFTELDGNESPLYGGNVNRLRYDRDRAWIVMENPSVADADSRSGQCVLAAEGGLVMPFERWGAAHELMGFLNGTPWGEEAPWRDTREYVHARMHGAAAAVPQGPSPPGRTWNGALAVPFMLEPGERASIRFMLTWHFPNRVVDFLQAGPLRDYGASTLWLGNAYARRFRDAEHVASHVVENLPALDEGTQAWVRCFAHGDAPEALLEAMAAQPVALRSPTCFVTDDGHFYGFEGSQGHSTTLMADRGGSCALNCTHVWNYEQALSRLFPALERDMRETELELAQAPDGSIPHRVVVPRYMRQLWEGAIIGPDRPALDGMLGCPLKVHRELRQGASRAWLERLWPRVVRVMDHVSERWDLAGDGILRGEQPNTYDMAFYGANTYIGSLWLAALLSCAELASMLDEHDRARAHLDKFAQASDAYDALLWNGSYYQQERTDADFEYGAGCLSDQLVGQWWAAQLGLGHVLPAEHVRSALLAVVEHNFREEIGGFEHRERVFADGADAGLLNCTWPRGGRPSRPLLYCDEVWSGTEYAVAHLCLSEGLRDAGLQIVQALRRRHDGTRRNPFNEIECGDHYVRAMAGWPLVEMLGGARCDAIDQSLELTGAPLAPGVRVPLMAGTGWGELERGPGGSQLSLTWRWGHADFARAKSGATSLEQCEMTCDGRSIELGQCTPSEAVFAGPIRLQAGSTLALRWADGSSEVGVPSRLPEGAGASR